MREWQRLTLCVLVSLGSVRRACGPVHTRRHISAHPPSLTHTNRRAHAHTRYPTDSIGGSTPPPPPPPPSYMCGSFSYASRRASGVHAAHHSLAHATRHASAARTGHGTCARMLPSAVPQHRWHPHVPRSLQWASMLLYHLRVEPTTIYHQKVEHNADTPRPGLRTLRDREYVLTRT